MYNQKRPGVDEQKTGQLTQQKVMIPCTFFKPEPVFKPITEQLHQLKERPGPHEKGALQHHIKCAQ